MTELNAASNRMVFIIDCKVKDIEGFKTWARDRAARYVYELKEENRISYEKKWEGTISITETPHITYDKSGRLIITPDQSFALGPKYV